MKNLSKISAIVIVLVLTFATTFVALPFVSAHTPAWSIPTYSYVSVAPNPTGVGQGVTVTFWLDKVPPTADGAYGDRWEDITIEVTKPDGSKETMGPYTSDPVGSVWAQYTPNQVGEYQFQGMFPEQVLSGDNPPPWGYGPISLGNPAYINDTYLASTSEIVTLTVQADPIQDWQSSPLPTEFWARPIYGENREWSSIASNWLAGSAHPNTFQPYGTAPNSAHVMWAKPLTWGGVVGEYGAIPYYEGLSYETYFSPPIIINGRLYYNMPTPPMYGFKCVDLLTGEEIWWRNGTGPEQLGWGFLGQNYPMLSFGQLLDYESPNQHGVIPYLWSTYSVPTGPFTSETYWAMYDPFTGNWICSIAGIPSGGSMFGASTTVTDDMGGILIHQIGADNSWMAIWNSTACIQDTYPSNNAMLAPNGYWMWRPPLADTVNATSGFTLNITLSGVPPTATVAGIDHENQVLIFGTNLATLGYTPLPSPADFTFCGVSLKAGQEGNLLWTTTRSWPTGNVTIEMGPAGSGVYVFAVKETMQLYCYSSLTGELVWGPSSSQGAWDMYGIGGAIACDRLFTCGYDGVLYCYDLETGEILWEYAAQGIGHESYYGNYPLNIGCIADSKIYLYSSEHSPTKPQWRGSAVRCVDMSDGTELWKIDCWAGTGFGAALAVADGYLITHNCYDNRIYCFGKGPSKTTVTASPKIITWGSSVMLEGMVTDQSAGTTQLEQAGRFPNGVPAVADEYQEAWMEYVYMQQGCPSYVEGVEVKLETLDPNNNFYEIGTVTTDASGMYKLMWEPPVPGEYTIIAIFAGSNSYYTSYAETSIGISETRAAQSIEPEPTTLESESTTMSAGTELEATEPTETPLITIEAALIAVVIIAAVCIIAFWALRKRE